ncbi:Qat anti-phage system associated protein QatB [Flaviaesturariibacter amylovorans]|uniref:Uncharacterized protein n=1 Tax=Flaviaesturariibacter amylovorans TaxID=1084520 RepID=A0ABP8H624_9BACT
MGTSNAYGGPKGSNPLVPSWLGGNAAPAAAQPGQAPVTPGANAGAAGAGPGVAAANAGGEAGPTASFTSAKSGFTRFVRSGGAAAGSLHKAASRYARTGGAQAATQRMGASRAAAGRFVSFFGAASGGGAGLTTALATFNLQGLLNSPVEDILSALIDHICPDGGTIDEGIARSAFVETIIALLDEGIDLDTLTEEQAMHAIGLFIAHSIEGRLCNDIGTKITFAADRVADIAAIQQELHDFIAGCVSDSLSQFEGQVAALTDVEIVGFVDQIYEDAFSILADVTNE